MCYIIFIGMHMVRHILYLLGKGREAMRVILIIGKKAHKKTRIMMEVLDRRAVLEVKSLVKSLRSAQAISDILSKGRFVKELSENEIANTHSDLILTDTNTYWNLL
ncbi:MAG: hypothetical protein ABID09_01455 [Candidatus Omnitrophota bacterium]